MSWWEFSMFYLFDKKLENLESYDELVLEIHKIHDSRHFFKIFRRRRTDSPPSPQNRCSENSFSFLEITRHAFFDQSAWVLGDLMWHDNKQGWWKWFANGRRCSQSKVVTHSLYFIDDLKVLEFFWRRVCFVHYIYF